MKDSTVEKPEISKEDVSDPMRLFDGEPFGDLTDDYTSDVLAAMGDLLKADKRTIIEMYEELSDEKLLDNCDKILCAFMI